MLQLLAWIQQGISTDAAHIAAYEEAEQLTENREVKPNELPVHGNTRWVRTLQCFRVYIAKRFVAN
jgi:hypothetical protein